MTLDRSGSAPAARAARASHARTAPTAHTTGGRPRATPRGGGRATPQAGGAPAFDSYDTRILAELQADARLTMAELGRRVHLSQPAATERVRRLESTGVITGYRAMVDLKALGYGIRALMRVGRAEYGRVVKAVQSTPEALSAYNVTGDDSWVIEIAVIDVAHLDAVVSKFCLLTETSTAIVLNVVRERLPARPARAEDVKAPRKGRADE